MRTLGRDDRPREKLERHGVSALGDNELLALVIGHGTPRADALSLANRLLSAAGGVAGLTRMDRAALHAVPGVGAVGAARIQAAVEMGRRTLARAMPPRRQIVTASDAADVLLPEYGAHPVERVGVMLLDSRHRVIRVQLVSSGVIDASVATPRDVFRAAIAGGASAVILFHNHPTGDVEPSKDDVDLTERMVAAGEVVGVPLVDHLILADGAFVSMNDHFRLSGRFPRRARRP